MKEIAFSRRMSKRDRFYYIILLRWLKKTIIVEIVSLTFIILYLYTGITKLIDYAVFKEQLAESAILASVSSVVAGGVPLIEILISFFLFLPRYRLKGLYAATALMMAFTVYIILMLSFNDELPCSCGGLIGQLSWSAHLVLNSTLCVLGFLGIKYEKGLRFNRQ